VGDPTSIIERLQAFEDAGADAVMLECEPALEETERFARDVIAPYRAAVRARATIPTSSRALTGLSAKA
jgi:2-methylisocitrate lyase-like PEP mutase family enzyme